jgi:hypothetical protein
MELIATIPLPLVAYDDETFASFVVVVVVVDLR